MKGNFIFILFLTSFGFAQELPPIQNYTPVDYAAENQNWGVTQSEEKSIYIANNGGLLEFNGAVWKLYGSPSGSAIRSVKSIGDFIYTGCYMEFGFWEKDALGELKYHSISRSLQVPLLEDEEFWNIEQLDNWVLFQSLERIYIYNTTNNSIRSVEAKSTKAHIFNFDETIYYHSMDNGLFKIENGISVLASDDPIIKNGVVLGVFSINNQPLLVTEKGEFYLLDDNGGLSRWGDVLVNTNSVNVYSSLQLSDDSIVLGTISNGIYHFSATGKILRKIDQEKGLNNNTILSIFEDEEHNLWLGLDNGISVVNMDSPFNEYIDKNGKLGVVYASKVYKNHLYLGTNQGLFYKTLNSDYSFNLVAGTEGQVWLLKIVDDVLFCGHNNGTYTVNKNAATLISDFPGTWDLKPIPNHNNLLLQGNFNGLSVLEKNEDRWKLKNVIEGFDISSRFIEFISENEVAVNRELKGIFKLKLDSEFKKVIAVENEASKGNGASLVRYLDDVLYACSNGISNYDNVSKSFVLDSALTKMFYGKQDDPIGVFIPDAESKRLWCFTKNNIAYVSQRKLDSNSQVRKISIPSYVRKNLGVLGFESLTPIGNGKYLIGISNGYLVVDINKQASKEYAIHINAIARRSSDAPLEKISRDTTTNFEFAQNNLFFSYNVPEYDKYTQVSYQYQLEGIYDSWSDWSTTSNVSFENLPYGDYTFNVRAKIGNDFSSNQGTYAFEIRRPWYASNLAIILYLISLILTAILIHKLYKRYYKKQQENILLENKKKLKRKKLKSQKKIVQIKNEKLREEVENKNRELAISTMSIIKKNEFLNAIKDELKSNADNPQIKNVIKTIDRNINNSDDWKFFEDAFNNADKDFLKKVKGLHPELTANDLRLCAYLRLNLSSKEIAPLLNISVRSVEVKRYRLRKKMNLLHEDGLTDYIMEL